MFEIMLRLLQATHIPFAAYAWNRAPDPPYGVISLEGQEDSDAGDDRITHQAIRGSIDLFVADKLAPEPKTVQDAINGVVPWRLNSVQFEDDTGLIHWEWIFEQVGL